MLKIKSENWNCEFLRHVCGNRGASREKVNKSRRLRYFAVKDSTETVTKHRSFRSHVLHGRHPHRNMRSHVDKTDAESEFCCQRSEYEHALDEAKIAVASLGS